MFKFIKQIIEIWNRQFNSQWFLAKKKADNYLKKGIKTKDNRMVKTSRGYVWKQPF